MSAAQLTDLDLRLLRVLDALLETNSVTRAAAMLGVTPSAVSHSLRELRTLMGDPLLVRAGSGLRPTPRAEATRPALRAAITGLRRVLDRAPDFDPGDSRRPFSLATPDSLLLDRLPKLLTDLRNEAPGVSVRFYSIMDGAHERLASGELDLVLTAAGAESFLSLDRDMMRTRVMFERFVCVVRADHPALCGGSLTLETYLALPHIFVSLSGVTRGVVDDVLATLGHSREVALTLPGGSAVLDFVAATDMIATIPESLVPRGGPPEGIAICDVPFDLPEIEAFLWWHARFQYDPAHIWWRGKIATAMGR